MKFIKIGKRLVNVNSILFVEPDEKRGGITIVLKEKHDITEKNLTIKNMEEILGGA